MGEHASFHSILGYIEFNVDMYITYKWLITVELSLFDNMGAT